LLRPLCLVMNTSLTHLLRGFTLRCSNSRVLQKRRVSPFRILSQFSAITFIQYRGLHRPVNLPYRIEDGLTPLFSIDSLTSHHNKVYYNHILRLNQLIENTEYEMKSLEDIVEKTSQWADDALVNSVASEVWNHAFFFSGLIPGGSPPSKHFLNIFDVHFNGFNKFKETFTRHALAVFGSGWTWLVDNDGHLDIVNTFNHVSLAKKEGVTPLLVVDLWEHAYYLDFRNDRRKYLEAWWQVVNWAWVEENHSKIQRQRKFLS